MYFAEILIKMPRCDSSTFLSFLLRISHILTWRCWVGILLPLALWIIFISRIVDIRWLIFWSSNRCWGVGSLHRATLYSAIPTCGERLPQPGRSHGVWRRLLWQRHQDILQDSDWWGDLGGRDYTARGEVISLININNERNPIVADKISHCPC